MLKNCLTRIDLTKAFQMIVGVLGIYVSFLLLGIVYQKITATEYLNSYTGAHQHFRFSSTMLFTERFIIWIFGELLMIVTMTQQEKVDIPIKNGLIIGFLTWLMAYTQTQAIYLVSYPLVMMAKACGLITAILVAVLCSRVRSKELKLGPQKIVIGVIVTIGIIVFGIFDPEANSKENKDFHILGLLLLLVSLFADGFIPDFNAEVKDLFKPNPIQMMCVVNKYVALVSFLFEVVTLHIKDSSIFMVQHPDYIFDMLLMTVFSFLGQMFIYRMIKTFKQHIVPFVIATRRIVTVAISMVYFHHRTNAWQIVAIIVVFCVTVYEFYDNITKVEEGKNSEGEKNGDKHIQNDEHMNGPNGYIELEQELEAQNKQEGLKH